MLFVALFSYRKKISLLATPNPTLKFLSLSTWEKNGRREISNLLSTFF